MKNKICVIFTGGTIGSAASGTSVGLNGDTKRLLLQMYTQQEGDGIQFTTLSPVNMLSENVQTEDLDALYNCVKQVNCDEYDGIIITHGTDTLCFTANYFSQVFGDIKIPIVFVSALYPLTDERSNGLANFCGAIKFIMGVDFGGVFVSFKNGQERCKIHLGSRIIFSDELNGYYHSAFGEHFAEITSEGAIVYPRTPRNPTPEQVKCRQSLSLPNGLCQKVMLITARSLLDFTAYDFSHVKPKAVIVELYHSGTIDTKGKFNFRSFAEYCKQSDVPLVIAPVDSRANVYSSMQNLPDNVMIAYDMTLEMTVVKMMCALAQNLAVNAYFDMDIFFEKINVSSL
jgi:L-asparaginase